MGVKRYRKKGKTLWRVDTWLDLPDGTKKRWRQGDIPTKEMALAIERKAQTSAMENKFFSNRPILTVAKAWENYEPLCKRDNKSWRTDACRAAHFVRLLGNKKADTLALRDIDKYRAIRSSEENRYGRTPAISSVNREVSLLRRTLNHAVEYGDLDKNPLVGVKMMDEDNVREVTVSEAEFQRLLDNADDHLKPVLITAYDTGLREEVILDLKWKYIDLREGCIRLPPKTNRIKRKPPATPLTTRVIEALSSLPRSISGYVFVNPQTGTRWADLKKSWDTARRKTGLKHVWFHDLRRSFVTNARRRGVPESVVMRMSGHKTRSVFDRYNIVSEDDLWDAVSMIESGRARELGEPQRALVCEAKNKEVI